MAISISPLELWVPHVHTQTHMVVSYNGGTPKPWISIWYTKIVWVWIPLFSETPTSPMRCYAFSLPSHPVVLHPADLCKLRPRRHWPSHQVKLAQQWNMSYVLYIILYYIILRIGGCLSDYILIVYVEVVVPVMTLQGHQLPHCCCFLQCCSGSWAKEASLKSPFGAGS